MYLASIIAIVCLFAWLTFETVWDLRSRKVPFWFSLILLVPGLLWLAWYVSPWAAILMGFSIASTEAIRRSRTLGLLGLCAPLVLVYVFFPALLPLVVAWGVLCVVWLVKWMGGADALAGLALLLFFPAWPMAACLALGLLVWGLVMLAIRHRHNLGLRLWGAISNKVESERLPALGAFALAALLYALARLLHVA